MILSWKRKVARAAIFDSKTKLFLLTKSTLPPFKFHLPGGGIHRNEPAEEAVRRELREELNIQPENILAITFAGKQDESVMCIPHTADIFVIQVVNLDIKLSWEIWKAEWFKKEELQRFMHLDEHILKEINDLDLI